MQTFCWFDENEPAKSLYFDILHVCKLFAGSSKMNQQKVCTSTFYTCANFLLVRRKWTSKKFVISTFAWESKLVVVEPDIWLFALVCLTVQWSCRSMLMLWWSDSSAKTTVLMQWYSSVNIYMCVLQWKLLEAASSTFITIVHVVCMTKRISISHVIKHHNWQRSECGWKCFNICTNNFDNTSCWLTLCGWSVDACLGLNACKRVV